MTTVIDTRLVLKRKRDQLAWYVRANRHVDREWVKLYLASQRPKVRKQKGERRG